MSRTFSFCLPTLLRCLVGQILGSLLLRLFYLPTASQTYAAAPPPVTPSGLNTQVTLSAMPPAGKTQFDITGGTRPGGGPNLFHSCGQFKVPNHNIVNFLNDTGSATTNILGRVTGGNPSSIFDTIQTSGAGGFGHAPRLLVNPAGGMFSPSICLSQMQAYYVPVGETCDSAFSRLTPGQDPHLNVGPSMGDQSMDLLPN